MPRCPPPGRRVQTGRRCFHGRLDVSDMGPIIGFFPTIARQLGFSISTYGYVLMFVSAMTMVLVPVAGVSVTRFRIKKPLFYAVTVLCIGSTCGLMFVPRMPPATAARDVPHCEPASGHQRRNGTANDIACTVRTCAGKATARHARPCGPRPRHPATIRLHKYATALKGWVVPGSLPQNAFIRFFFRFISGTYVSPQSQKSQKR